MILEFVENFYPAFVFFAVVISVLLVMKRDD